MSIGICVGFSNILDFNFSSTDEGNNGSSLPSFPPGSEVKDSNKGQDNFEKQQIMGGIFEIISPVTAIIIMLGEYFFLVDMNSSSILFTASLTVNTIQYHNIYIEVSLPVMITFALFSYFAWEWGTKPSRHPYGYFKWTNLSVWLPIYDFWEMMGISGLVLWCLEYSVYSIVSFLCVMLFLLWKLGSLMMTRVLQEDLSWLNLMALPRRR